MWSFFRTLTFLTDWIIYYSCLALIFTFTWSEVIYLIDFTFFIKKSALFEVRIPFFIWIACGNGAGPCGVVEVWFLGWTWTSIILFKVSLIILALLDTRFVLKHIFIFNWTLFIKRRTLFQLLIPFLVISTYLVDTFQLRIVEYWCFLWTCFTFLWLFVPYWCLLWTDLAFKRGLVPNRLYLVTRLLLNLLTFTS